MFQIIYARALDEPAIGYGPSSKFRRGSGSCPKCGGTIWLRLRRASGTVIGVTCETCPWIHTYVVRLPLPPSPVQPLLFKSSFIFPD